MKIWIYCPESNFWIYIYIVLNKNWKIYRSEQSFTGLEPEDRCSSCGLSMKRTFTNIKYSQTINEYTESTNRWYITTTTSPTPPPPPTLLSTSCWEIKIKFYKHQLLTNNKWICNMNAFFSFDLYMHVYVSNS